MRTVAPAKVNWTLEVLGRREDGYHEIRSVMQTIDLCDEISAEPSDATSFETMQGEPLADDLIVTAARVLEERVGRAFSARVRVEKRIPVASGLGGGSSDAAAVLRLLNRLCGVRLTGDELSHVAADIGSDVPFFVFGGTGLVEGRGERVTPLPDVGTAWLVLVVSPMNVVEKTKRMYQELRTEDFSDGSPGDSLTQRLQRREPVRGDDVHNVFERVAYGMFEGLETYRDALLSAGAHEAHLAGAGPTLFALAESETEARALAKRVQAPGAKVFVTRTLSASEATAVTD